MNEELEELAEIIRRFASIEILANAIENGNEDIEALFELCQYLEDELEYSGW